MHGVEVVVGAVGEDVGVVAVVPDGGHRGVAALGDDASERPTVDQVAPEDHVLHDDVAPRWIVSAAAWWGRRGDSGGDRRCVGGGAHVPPRRRSVSEGPLPNCGNAARAGAREDGSKADARRCEQRFHLGTANK